MGSMEPASCDSCILMLATYRVTYVDGAEYLLCDNCVPDTTDGWGDIASIKCLLVEVV